jgi:hypothetical protein
MVISLWGSIEIHPSVVLSDRSAALLDAFFDAIP